VFPAGAQQLSAALQLRAAQQNADPSATQEDEALAELQRRKEIGDTLLRFNRNFYGH